MDRQARVSASADLPGNPFERGIYLSAGRGGQVDLVEAQKWFNIAAANGDRSAAQHRDELAEEMSRQELAAALRAAREWITRH
jgi:TPR repeat protein